MRLGFPRPFDGLTGMQDDVDLTATMASHGSPMSAFVPDDAPGGAAGQLDRSEALVSHEEVDRLTNPIKGLTGPEENSGGTRTAARARFP